MSTYTSSRFSLLHKKLNESSAIDATGHIQATRGSMIVAKLPRAAIGELCWIAMKDGTEVPAEVVAFDGDLTIIAPFNTLRGVEAGGKIRSSGNPVQVSAPKDPRGMVLDALGNVLADRSQVPFPTHSTVNLSLECEPPSALQRKPIETVMRSGIRAIDAFLTIGYGQRIGILAGAGVGKSTLIGMITRAAVVDVVVIALVGERGREVQEFVDEVLGAEGMRRAVVVAATSDESPLRRLAAAKTATALAEQYRERGLNVLLIVDSLTRTARAIREIGLAAGELPVRQGYTSSVFTELPRLLERAGNNDKGSITALYTILSNGEHDSDPLAEEIKSILDGHFVLDSNVAATGIRPAINLGNSVSRLFTKITSAEHAAAAQKFLVAWARLQKDKELLLLGGEPDEELKKLLREEPRMRGFLTQNISTPCGAATVDELTLLAKSL